MQIKQMEMNNYANPTWNKMVVTSEQTLIAIDWFQTEHFYTHLHTHTHTYVEGNAREKRAEKSHNLLLKEFLIWSSFPSYFKLIFNFSIPVATFNEFIDLTTLALNVTKTILRIVYDSMSTTNLCLFYRYAILRYLNIP